LTHGGPPRSATLAGVPSESVVETDPEPIGIAAGARNATGGACVSFP
jgi:hypothetical protein